MKPRVLPWLAAAAALAATPALADGMPEEIVPAVIAPPVPLPASPPPSADFRARKSDEDTEPAAVQVAPAVMPAAAFDARAARLRDPGTEETTTPPPRAEQVRVGATNTPRVSVPDPDGDGISAYVEPERTTIVAISRRDVNRIHCPTDVADTFYSKEKPVNVTLAGNNVWVKVLKKVINGTQETYDTTPIDLHVVCGDAVYTMILQPRAIDSVTLRLGNPSIDKAAAVAKEWGALPLEEKVARFTRLVYRDELPPNFQKRVIPHHPRSFRNMMVQGIRRISAPGLGLAAIEYEIIGHEPLTLDERDFLDIGLSAAIVGITVDPLVLDAQHRKARLIIIERSLSDGR